MILECIAKITVLHHTQKVIVLDHQDCGAWGGSQRFKGDAAAEQDFHRQKLLQAQRVLKTAFPRLKLALWYWRSGSLIKF